MESLHKNTQLMLEFLKAPFLALHISYYTLMTFLMMLSVILLSVLMILLSVLSVIRLRICGNKFKCLLNLNLIYETLWTGVKSGLFSAGNNILNPGSHHDQIILLLGGQFKFQTFSWYMPKNPVGHHGWETKKILQFRSSKTAFFQRFFTIFYSKI